MILSCGVGLPIRSLADPLAFIAPSDALILLDGDTLIHDRVRYRLAGIDAPETRQICQTSTGQTWSCGVLATSKLRERMGNHTVRCEGQEADRYNRVIVTCSLEGAQETLNGFMVRSGWAMAYRRYSQAYVADEDAARHEGRGIWSGPVVAPWDWRRGLR